MIMPVSNQRLLMPVNRAWMWGSIMAALLVNLIPMGRLAGMPDVLALVLLFWCIHEPLKVGVVSAFVLGILMDVHQGAVLGQHALTYSVMAFLGAVGGRRLTWFTVPSQAVQLFPVFLSVHGLLLAIRLGSGGMWPGWSLLWAPVLESLLWPVMHALLLFPQRRPPDRDATRPL